MAFVRSLIDPYKQFSEPSYFEAQEEEKKPDPLQRPTERMREETGMPNRAQGAGFGQSFLVSLLQSAPAMARVMSANSTDDIQRALSDHAEAMQRYAENRQLQQERATERDFTLQRDEAQATQRAQENEADRALRRELTQTEIDASDRRYANEAQRDDERYNAERSAEEAQLASEVQAETTAKLGVIQAYAQPAQGVQVVDPQTGRLTVDGEAAYQRGVVAREAELAQRKRVESTGRQMTPEEAMLARMEGTIEFIREDWEKRDPVMRKPFAEVVDETTGLPGYYQRYVDMSTGKAFAPDPPEPQGVAMTRVLSNPNHPDFQEVRSQVAGMGVSEFKATWPQLVQGMTPEAAQKALERFAAYASPEVQREILRMVGGTQSRAGQIVGGAAGAVGDALGSAITNWSPLGSAISTFRQGMGYLTEEVPK